MFDLTMSMTSRQHAAASPGARASLTIDDGFGNVVADLPEGGSVEVSVDDGPIVTLVDQPGSEDVGFVYAPSFSGPPSAGRKLTIDLGIVYFQGPGPVTIEQDILRNGAVIAADIRSTNGPETFDYTVVQADLGQSVQVRSRLTNGGNAVEILTDIVTPADMPIEVAGANGWYDFADISTLVTPGGGVGNEIATVRDKSGSGNDLTQPTLAKRPRRAQSAETGRVMARFESNDVLIAPDLTVRAVFVVLSDVQGRTTGIGPVLGTHGQTSGADHQHIFIRTDGRTDYDISVDGTTPGTDTGTVHVDTGASGSGENVTLAGLSVAAREGTRLWYVAMDQDITPVDAIGMFRSKSVTYNHDGTLFGEVVTFPAALTAAEANAVGGDIAARWGLTWSDIT